MHSLLLSFLIVPTLFAQVVVGPERQLTTPDLRPAAFDQRDAATASDGSGWLVAWSSGPYQFVSNFIAASRIDSTGNVLDPTPIVIASGNVAHPAVAFGAGRYLLAWSTLDSVRVRLVGRDGDISPTIQIASIGGGVGVTFVRAAWDGARFAVVWNHTLDSGFSTNRKSIALLDANGNVVTSSAIVEGLSSIDFALAAGKGEFVMFDSTVDFSGTPTGNGYPSAVRAFRIDDAGHISGSVEIERATTPVFSPRAAFNGREFLVVWSTNSALPGQARGARLSADGTSIPIPSFYSGPDTVNTLTWTGSESIVTLSDQQRVDAIRLEANGSLQTIMTASNTSASDAAWNGQRLLVAMDAAGDVYEGFLDSAPRPIALSPAHQESPSIASLGGGDSLVVWLENKTAMAVPLHEGLTAADHSTVLGAANIAPVVASDPTQYFVVWSQFPLGLVGQRVDRHGVAIDPQPLVINSTVSFFGRPAVNFDGENFIVAYEVGGGCTHGSSLTQFVSRVSPAGVVLDPKSVTVGGRSCGTELSLASGPSGSLLAWSGLDGPSAAFITKGGSTPGPMRLSPMLSGIQLRAVWAGTQFIVADITASGVEWLTVSDNGTPYLHGFTPHANVSLISTSFSPLKDGALFVWSTGDLWGLRFSRDGMAIGEPIAISKTEFDETNISVAEDGVIAYQRTIDFPGVANLSRIFTHTIEVIPPPLRRRASR